MKRQISSSISKSRPFQRHIPRLGNLNTSDSVVTIPHSHIRLNHIFETWVFEAVKLLETSLKLDDPYWYNILGLLAKDNQEVTLLFLACKFGFLWALETLERTSTRINWLQQNKRGLTPLGLACRGGYADIVGFLFKKEVAATSNDFFVAAENGHDSVVDLLICQPTVNVNFVWPGWFQDNTALTMAVRNGHLGVVERLLKGPDVKLHAPGPEGGTLLMRAAQYGQMEVVRSLITGPRVDVNEKDLEGRTALFWALKNEQTAVAEFLLSHPDLVLTSESVGK
jgi:ankyrin repeat protein